MVAMSRLISQMVKRCPAGLIDFRCFFVPGCLFLLSVATVVGDVTPSTQGAPFQVLADRCLSCHGEKSQKGGLRLDSRAAFRLGGDSGPVFNATTPSMSELLLRVRASDPDLRMPPKGEPLSDAELALLEDWILKGADWPDSDAGSISGYASKFWSLEDLGKVRVPEVPVEWRKRVRNPIDSFILSRLQENGLSPTPEADRGVLLRRLYYDLLGLPPTADEIESFVNDPSPGAYEQRVDALLASPRFGERWARHWLDLVHFGETHGYDKDKPRPNAWPYRDYVIRALNDDRPYSRFVEEQLAGDRLYPNTLDGIAATGFIAAGPWDFIGHAEVPETKIDGRVARNLDRDDMVATTMNTFVSTTVQCARCHDHKFDPVEMEDYYELQSIFAALDRSDALFDPDPTVRRERMELAESIATLRERQTALQEQAKELGGEELKQLETEISQLENPGQRHPAYGYHSAIESRQEMEKWVQIDLGEQVTVDRIEYFPADDDYNGIGAGFGFPVRYRIEVSNESSFERGAVVVADYTEEDVTNPRNNRQRVLLNGKPVRFVRLTATKLAPRSDDYIFALAEVQIRDKDGRNRAIGKVVTALDSIEQGPRWGRPNLVDGIYPGVNRPSEENEKRLEIAKHSRRELLQSILPEEQQQERENVDSQLTSLEARLRALPEPMKLYIGRVHRGNGAFRGTGHEGGKPREIRILRRGDITNPGKTVGPGVPPLYPGGEEHFELSTSHHEGDRRVALTRWILDQRNPLTWRSIVNRVWQHHFGRGIVDSPSDFGRMGQEPTHPELLDWLATEFRDGGQSLKKLHRLIVTSATYRQASTNRPEAAEIDAGNRFLWRAHRRRLDAESIRDSVLVFADRLDGQMFGPSFQDFVIEKPEHSPHYQYHLHDPNDPRSHRRSVYRFLVRSQQQPFMTTLDCADPSMMVEKRSETLTPLQALSLLNNRFMTTMAERMGERLQGMGDQWLSGLERMFYQVTGRAPEEDELDMLRQHYREHGAANTCRILLNLNEFIFVD